MRNLEKLCKLKEDLRDKEGEIRQLIDHAMDGHGLVRESFSTPVVGDLPCVAFPGTAVLVGGVVQVS